MRRTQIHTSNGSCCIDKSFKQKIQSLSKKPQLPMYYMGGYEQDYDSGMFLKKPSKLKTNIYLDVNKNNPYREKLKRNELSTERLW